MISLIVTSRRRRLREKDIYIYGAQEQEQKSKQNKQEHNKTTEELSSRAWLAKRHKCNRQRDHVGTVFADRPTAECIKGKRNAITSRNTT